MIEFKIEKIKGTASTNETLSALIKAGKAKEGTVLTTDYQTNGKGYAGARWESRKGENLLVSFFLTPEFLPAEKQFYLSIVTSLTLFDLLKELTQKEALSIKWPNDLYFQRKKIAGILIENSVTQQFIAESVIGVGLNVNQTNFPSYLPNPISMKMISGKNFEVENVLNTFLSRFAGHYERLKSGDYKSLEKAYINSMFLRGQKSLFKDKEGDFEGTIEGIDRYGRLKINTPSGDRIYGFKEVEYQI